MSETPKRCRGDRRDAVLLRETEIKNSSRYRVKNLPGAGAMLLENDKTERQISLLD